MLPMSLTVSLGRYNTESEALPGRGNGAAMGPTSRRAPCLFFLPYRVRLIALVTLVVFFLFGVAGNAFLASSERSSPHRRQWRRRVWPQLRGAPPPFLPGPFDLFSVAQITYPFGVM